MERFHAVIYCGAIPELNLSLEKLLCVGGTLIAPVETAEGSQQFQLLCRRSATNTENIKITHCDFFLFEKVQ
jgi:protein-L-isoaspartate O-methyltransferase